MSPDIKLNDAIGNGLARDRGTVVSPAAFVLPLPEEN